MTSDPDDVVNKKITDIDGNILRIIPLGAGQEVGRSCIIVEYRQKKVMLDCGIHPGLNGVASLPYLDQIDPSEIDLILITHFHMDHCGSLPWFLAKTNFKGRVFMTHATKAIYKWLLSDYIKIISSSSNDLLYGEKELEDSLDRIETIYFHQEHEVSNIRFTCYHAGHVLGAAMFRFDIAGVQILYTGDFSCQEDRHLIAAEVPSIIPDLLIMESTYGIHLHADRETRESRFTSFIKDVVLADTSTGGGKCLIPIFSLGRAQELLLILDEFWRNSPELHHIPIYYASNLAKKCMNVYQTYISCMNERIKKQLVSRGNPFNFRYIQFLKSLDDFDDSRPCVVLASPGMLQNGISRNLFEMWCSNPNNGVMLAGYSVDGTLAKELASEPEQIVSLTGKLIPRKCKIGYVSFSAHADYAQILNFVRQLMPKQIVLVHGEKHEMARMKSGLVRDCSDINLTNENIYTPPNCYPLCLGFRGDHTIKIIGSLSNQFQCDQRISGILVRRGFSYHLIDPSELGEYTSLNISNIFQRIVVPFNSSVDKLIGNLNTLNSGPLKLSNQINSLELPCTFGMINDTISVTLTSTSVVVEWSSDKLTDMYAEAIIAVIIETSECNPHNLSVRPGETDCHDNAERLKKLLHNFYEKIELNDDENHKEQLIISYTNPKDKTTIQATIDVDTLDVKSNSEAMMEQLRIILNHYKCAINPFCCI